MRKLRQRSNLAYFFHYFPINAREYHRGLPPGFKICCKFRFLYFNMRNEKIFQTNNIPDIIFYRKGLQQFYRNCPQKLRKKGFQYNPVHYRTLFIYLFNIPPPSQLLSQLRWGLQRKIQTNLMGGKIKFSIFLQDF